MHQKKATAVALTAVSKADEAAFDKIVESSNAHFANNADARRKWGGGVMGLKTVRAIEKREKMIAVEAAKKVRAAAGAAVGGRVSMGGRYGWARARCAVTTNAHAPLPAPSHTHAPPAAPRPRPTTTRRPSPPPTHTTPQALL